jgi:glutamyl-tRNA reductase
MSLISRPDPIPIEPRRLRLCVWGIDHHSASTALREQVAMAPERIEAFLDRCNDAGLDSLIVLSTCNRTEFYVETKETAAAAATIAAALASEGIDFALFTGEQGWYMEDDEAILHLYRVTAGLESLMIGEPQIAGQVKDAYRLAAKHRPLGAMLERAFHSSFRACKHVRSRTRVGEGAVSVAYAAVELSRKFFQELPQQRALLVGAGDTGTLAGRHFVAAEMGNITVLNRSPERAALLAEKLNGDREGVAVAGPLTDLEEALSEADVVLCSTAAQEPIVLPEMVARALKKRKGAPIFMLDVAVPRDIHPDVANLGGAYCFGMEDLDEIVQSNVSIRRKELPKAEQILEAERKQFRRWAKNMSLGPIVGKFHNFLEEMKRAELQRYSKQMSGETEAAVEEALRAFINKIMYRPVNRLKTTQDESARMRDLDSLCRLFDLEDGEED